MERKAALKSGEYERVEIIEMFLEKVAAEVKCELKKKGIINRKHKEKKIKNDLYNEIFKEVESVNIYIYINEYYNLETKQKIGPFFIFKRSE